MAQVQWIALSLAYLSVLVPLNFSHASLLQESVWGRYVVSINLLTPHDLATLKQLETEITERLKSLPQNTPERSALELALALSLRQQKNWSLASKYLSHIDARSLLGMTARAFLTEAHIEEGKRYADQNNWSAAKTSHGEAMRIWGEIASKLFLEPVESLTPQVQAELSLLGARIDLASSHWQKAKNTLSSLLQSTLMESSTHRELIVGGLAETYFQTSDGLSLQALSLAYDSKLASDPRFGKLISTQGMSTPEPPAKKISSDLSSRFVHPADTLLVKAKNDISALSHIARTYPLSDAAITANLRLDAQLRALVKKPVPTRVVESLKSLPPDTLYKLGQELWNADQLDAAHTIYRAFLQKVPYDLRVSNVYYFIGRIYEDQLLWIKARDAYKSLIETHPNSTFGERSLFKVGFMSYLAKDYLQAQKWFQHYRAQLSSPHQRAEANYWLGEVQRKLKPNTHDKSTQQLIAQEAPLSYYAALLEQAPPLKDEPLVFSQALSGHEKHLIEHILMFLGSGLHTFAHSLLAQLELTNMPDRELLILKLYYDAKNYSRSFSMTFDFLQNAPPPWNKTALSLFFPPDYKTELEKLTHGSNLDTTLLQSLIKQESAFQSGAKSRVGATGLMQLMPATASVVSKTHNIAYAGLDDLLIPKINLSLGVSYFSSLMKDFNQSPSRALAAYNAGPKRVAVWSNRWKNLSTHEWIELIPLDETRNYVKTIFRNYAFYKLTRGEPFSISQLMK